jgi:uncharacterized protein
MPTFVHSDFEWDADKAASNLEKHKLSFELARSVFNDPFMIQWVDDRRDYGELRLIAVGVVFERALTVCYTLRGGRIRLINARKANPNEEYRYEQAKTRSSDPAN